MSKNDPIKQVIHDGRDQMSLNVQKRLLTHISGKFFLELQKIPKYFLYWIYILAGLGRSNNGAGFSEDEFLSIPTSRLSLLLDLSVNHTDNFKLHETDKKYLEGWQHCLLSIAGKFLKTQFWINFKFHLIYI